MKLFKPIAAVCFTLVASASAFSTPSTVDLQGETFTVDTLRHYKCGPGMTRTALEYRSTTGNTRIQAFVIKTMLREAENVKFKVEIGNDSCLNAETVTSMGRRHSVEGGCERRLFHHRKFRRTVFAIRHRGLSKHVERKPRKTDVARRYRLGEP